MGPEPAPWESWSIGKTLRSVLSTEREKQAGSTGWEAVWEGEYASSFMLFPLEFVFWEGPFPEVGGYGQEG